jgi:hypothetical protein
MMNQLLYQPIKNQRLSEESNINEVTTDHVTPSSSIYEQSSYPSSTITLQNLIDELFN